MENLENAKSFSAQIASIKNELAKDVVGSEEIIAQARQIIRNFDN